MRVSEKQLQIMFRILEGSLVFFDNTNTLNPFGYDYKTRKKIYNDILNQQSDKIIDVKELNNE